MKKDRNKQDGNRDDVGTLLRLAGKRKPVPQERADRVRAAAREQFRQETKSRSRRRVAWAAAGLLAAASLIIVMVPILLRPGGGAASGIDATILVEVLNGMAQVREKVPGGGTSFRRISVGERVARGTEIATVGESRAALRLASGGSMRLDTSTRVRWVGGDSFDLKHGAVYVDSGPEEGLRRHVEIVTSYGSVHDIGTQFEVRLEAGWMRVRLREGIVAVRAQNATHEIETGTELTLDSDSAITQQQISPCGTEWDWVAAVTPMPDLEGRSARSFLEWVARERGWVLEFADPTLGQSSREILLDGSFDHLSLDQVLEAVLPTCRMTHRVEQGVLIVSAAPGI